MLRIKRLFPPVVLLLSLLLDTTVVPVFYNGNYKIMFTIAVVMIIGIQLKRMTGMFYGLAAGLILDVTAGTLGHKFFAFIAFGFLAGFFLDTQPEISRNMPRKERFERLLIRFIWVFILTIAYEIVMFAIQYAYNAVIHVAFIRDLLIRTFAQTILTMLLYTPLHTVFDVSRVAAKRTTREEKNF